MKISSENKLADIVYRTAIKFYINRKLVKKHYLCNYL